MRSGMSVHATESLTIPRDQFRAIIHRLVAEFAPRALYLFGSHAYGTPRPDSDVDVLVILAGTLPSLRELSIRGRACLEGLGLPVELHFCDEMRFDSWGQVEGSFQHEVRSRGHVLYAA
jgi:predicted nucleotidyltransferase